MIYILAYMAIRPLISVIVIAHERKEFILDAIRSLKDQSAPKESYEVLIIKKFVDREIDDFIAKNGELIVNQYNILRF